MAYISKNHFNLNDKEFAESCDWKKKHAVKCGKATFQFIFTTTGIGVVFEVQCLHCKKLKNLTDYDSW